MLELQINSILVNKMAKGQVNTNKTIEEYTQNILNIMERSTKDFDSFKKEMKQMQKEKENDMKELSKTIGGYTKNEANAIENDVNRRLPQILKRKFPNANIFKINSWKVLIKNKRSDFISKTIDSKEITEFDGLYIISSDPDFEVLDEDVTIASSVKTGNSKTKRFVVMEAKHALDIGQIDTKVAQMITFKNYISDSQHITSTPKIFTNGFLKKVDNYQLQDFIEQPLYLIFASPLIPQNVIDHIQTKSVELNALGIVLAYMIPSGNYGISWADRKFTTQTNVNATGVTLIKSGGR